MDVDPLAEPQPCTDGRCPYGFLPHGHRPHPTRVITHYGPEWDRRADAVAEAGTRSCPGSDPVKEAVRRCQQG